MSADSLHYQSPGIATSKRPISAALSISASTFAIVMGLGAYLFIYVYQRPMTIFHVMAMGFVVFILCAPAFLIAAIAAIVAVRNPLTLKRTLLIALSLVGIQALCWIVLIVHAVLQPPSRGGPPGGF